MKFSTNFLIAVTIVMLNGGCLADEAANPKITPDHPDLKYDWNLKPGDTIPVRPGPKITYLGYQWAKTQGDVKRSGFKNTGLAIQGKNASATWHIQSDKPHEFIVRALAGGRYLRTQEWTIYGPKNNVRMGPFKLRGKTEETLKIPPGKSSITIREGHILGLELIDKDHYDAYLKRVEKFRGDTSWMCKRTYGIMFQWGGWTWPQKGEKAPWPEPINNFDVELFADLMEEMGAGWITWSVTHGGQHMPAPIKARDKIKPGFTSKRDLLGEIADALAKRDIKLIFYFHPGHSDGRWWNAYARDENNNIDKNKWYDNFVRIVTEMGERYGDKLHGWGIDGGRHYYPGPYDAFGWALKTGNPERIMDYNPWRYGRLTDFQEISQAEGGKRTDPRWKVNEHCIYQEGPHKGLIAGGAFPLEGSGWGVNRDNRGKIKPPMFSKEQWLAKLNEARENHVTTTPCLIMWESGKINPKTYELFVHARRKFRGVSDEELIQKRKKRGDGPVARSYPWD